MFIGNTQLFPEVVHAIFVNDVLTLREIHFIYYHACSTINGIM